MSEPKENRRTSITFIPRAAQELDEMVASMGINQNDVTNRAVSIYAFLQGEFLKGNALFIGKPDGSDLERVHLM